MQGMQGIQAINDAREFCELYGMGDHCRRIAESHPTLYDFWQHSDRFDWMLKLLHVTAYRNRENILSVFHAITSERKKKHPLLGKYCDEPYKSMLEEDEGASVREGRTLKWCKVYVLTDIYAKAATELDSVLDLAVQLDLAGLGDRNDTSNALFDAQAMIDAKARISREHAELLRQLLGNPYDGTHSADFD